LLDSLQLSLFPLVTTSVASTATLQHYCKMSNDVREEILVHTDIVNNLEDELKTATPKSILLFFGK